MFQSLASQSPFFDRLFNGNFKEKNMAEIPIGDVSAEVSNKFFNNECEIKKTSFFYNISLNYAYSGIH